MTKTDIAAERPLRKPIPIKLRFAVLRRDGFRCQYCGCAPPDAELDADHVIPVACRGENVAWNLLTACETCNGGKAATLMEISELLRCPGPIARVVGLLRLCVLRFGAEPDQEFIEALIEGFWRGATADGYVAILLSSEDPDEFGTRANAYIAGVAELAHFDGVDL